MSWNKIEEDPTKVDTTKAPFDGKPFLGVLSNGWQEVGQSRRDPYKHHEWWSFQRWGVPMVHTHPGMSSSYGPERAGIRLVGWKPLENGPDWLPEDLREPY